MRILMVLTYYCPHTSGLTLYAQRLAKALVRRGHHVTVLASQHEAELPMHEQASGVDIVRAPVLFRVSKGVISPALYARAARLMGSHDVVLLHLPQFDSAGLALVARLRGKPVVITYHCDLVLPVGAFNRLANAVVLLTNNLAGSWADKVVAYTRDYAEHSAFLRRYACKREVILPPVELPESGSEEAAAFRARHNCDAVPIIGMATRFSAEKGVEVLLDALPAVLERFPRARVLFAGQYRDVWAEQDYFSAMQVRIGHWQRRGNFTFLGVLSQQEMGAFYANLGVLVVPSLNATESFGLVQIEAMQCGCPVVASDLPGVRQPVAISGAGKVVPPGDAGALARAIIEQLDAPRVERAVVDRLRARFDPDSCAASYERLFSETLRRKW